MAIQPPQRFQLDDLTHVEREARTIYAPGATPGDVLVVQSDHSLVAAPGGGSQPGAARVLGPFPFTFATPNLEAGVDFYTPTVGDILLDCWIETDTAWDGTTPLCDIGSALLFGDGPGILSRCSAGHPCDLGNADVPTLFNLLAGQVAPQGASGGLIYAASGGFTPARLVPSKFITTDPLQVVVSTDGTRDGSATGSATGASGIYLVIATPDAP